MRYKLSIFLFIFLLFTAETCEFHHRPDPPDPPYNFAQEKRSGIDIFCYSVPTFDYVVKHQGRLKGAAHAEYVDQAVKSALEHQCDAVFLSLEGYSFACIKYKELLPNLIDVLPGDTVRALLDKQWKDIPIYCYSKPSRSFTIQYHGPFTEKEVRWFHQEASRKSREFDSDAVIFHLEDGSYDCIKYDDKKD